MSLMKSYLYTGGMATANGNNDWGSLLTARSETPDRNLAPKMKKEKYVHSNMHVVERRKQLRANQHRNVITALSIENIYRLVSRVEDLVPIILRKLQNSYFVFLGLT